MNWRAELRQLLLRIRKPLGADHGFLLLGLVTTLTVGSILSSAANQEWSVIIRREKEAQLSFDQSQYAAAIMRYKEANGHLLVKLEGLNEVQATRGL